MRFKALYIFFLSAIVPINATNENITQYLEYAKAPNFGQIGDFSQGEMQLIDQFDSMMDVQKQYYDQFIQRGHSPDEAERFSRVGVVFEDKYWIWFRDPIRLPNGKTTAHNRFFPKSALNGAAGVSVMGISQENKILVNLIFRHATRSWEIELPRGGRGKHETSEQAALRELKEETGILAKEGFFLGSIASDSGILANVLDIFAVKDFDVTDEIEREDCEAISDCLFLSKETIKKAFAEGYLHLDHEGAKVKAYCRDAFLSSAILIAETKGIL